MQNQSSMPDATSCLRWFGMLTDLGSNPVEVALKSPVAITIALGCFIRKLSIFDWICSHKITFSNSLLAVDWYTTPRRIVETFLGIA